MWHLFVAINLGNMGLARGAPGIPPLAPEAVCPGSVGTLKFVAADETQDPRLTGKHLIVVAKKSRRVFLFRNGKMLHIDGKPACWRAGLGPEPTGHKRVEGDGKTPEGWYRTSDKPWSQWYAAIAIHYPNQVDAAAALEAKRISTTTETTIQQAIAADTKPPQTTAMGGEILIHGGGGSTDWTLGCIAMNNEDIDILRSTLPENMVTDVLILP